MGIVQRQSLQVTVVYYFGAALGFVNKIVLLTNFFSKEEVGLTNLLPIVAVFYAQVAALGYGNVGIRFFPYFENRVKRHHGFLFWSTIFVTVGLLFVTLLFLLFKPVVVNYYGKESPLIAEYYIYLIPLAFSIVYFQLFDTYLRALMKTVVATMLNEVVSRMALTVCIGFFAFGWINFHQFVILYVLSNILLVLIMVVYVVYLKQFHILPVQSPLIKRLFKIIMVYGIYTILTSFGAGIIKYLDSIMVTGMLNLGQAGIYTTAALLPVLMSLPYRTLQRTTYPLVARYWKAKDMTSMDLLYRKTTIIAMVLGGFMFLALWVNIDSIFSFMPAEYLKGRYVFLFAALAYYIDMITGLNGIILISSKKYRYDLWFLALLVVLTVVMNLIFIPLWGITGAAIAAAASVIIYNLLRWAFVWYNFRMQPFNIQCFWILFITLLTYFISLFIPVFRNRYLSILINSSIVSLFFGGLILIFKLSPDINQVAFSFTKWKFLHPGEYKKME